MLKKIITKLFPTKFRVRNILRKTVAGVLIISNILVICPTEIFAADYTNSGSSFYFFTESHHIDSGFCDCTEVTTSRTKSGAISISEPHLKDSRYPFLETLNPYISDFSITLPSGYTFPNIIDISTSAFGSVDNVSNLESYSTDSGGNGLFPYYNGIDHSDFDISSDRRTFTGKIIFDNFSSTMYNKEFYIYLPMINFDIEKSLSSNSKHSAGTYKIPAFIGYSYGGISGDYGVNLFKIPVYIPYCELTKGAFTVSKEYDGKTVYSYSSSSYYDAIKPTANGSLKIYYYTVTGNIITPSKNVGSYSKTQLDSSSIKVTKKSGNPGASISESNFLPATFTITKRPITPTITATDKVADGTNTADVQVSFTNVVEGEELIKGIDYDVTANFGDSEVGDNKTVTATITLKNTELANNYSLSKPTVTTTADIYKKDTSLVNSRIYNQKDMTTTDFNFNDTLKIDITPQDKINALSTSINTASLYINNILVGTQSASINNKITFSKDLSELIELGEGTYPVKVEYGGSISNNPTTLNLDNINISAIPVKFNINTSNTYNGSTDFYITNQVLYESDTNNLITEATYNANLKTNNKDVGTYNSSDLSLESIIIQGNRSKHYKYDDISIYDNSEFEITKKSINTNITVDDKLYDGNTIANINQVTFENLVNDEHLELNVDFSATANFNTADVGKDKIVTGNVELLDTNKSNNYILNNSNPTTTADISQSESQINNTQILNQNNIPTTTFSFKDILRIKGTPELKPVNLSNLIQPNKVEVYIDNNLITTVDCNIDSSFTTDIVLNDLSNINPGSHNIKVKWTGNNNLIASESNLGNIIINPIPITAEVSQSIDYNGTINFSNITSSTIKDKEDLSPIPLNIIATVTVDDKNFGTRNIISASDFNIQGDNANHYSISSEDITGTINITKKPITPISATVESKLYDDETSIKVTNVQFEDLVLSEKLILDTDYSATGELDDSNAGQNKDVTVKIKLLDSPVADNYYLSSTIVHTSTDVDKSTPNLEVNISDSVAIYGEEYLITVKPVVDKNVFSIGLDTVVIENSNGNTLAETSIKQPDGCYKLTVPANNLLEIGSNNITIKYGGSSNFLMKEQSANLTMLQRPTSISATPVTNTREYNNTPDFEISLNADDKYLLDDVIVTYNTNNLVQVSSSDASDIPYQATVDKTKITLSGEEGKYYTIKDKEIPTTINNLTITPDIIDLDNFTEITKVYDKAVTAYVDSSNFEVINQNANESLNITCTAEYDTSDVGTNKQVTITPSQNNPNYKFGSTTYIANTGVITKSDSTINNPEIDNVYTYGDIITLKVKPDIKRDLFSLSAPYEKVELFYEDTSLGQGDYNILTGKYELTYDTTDKLLPIGTHNLTVSFGGNTNYNPSESNIYITLNPKEISANYRLEYQYDNLTEKDITLNLEDVESEDVDTFSTLPAVIHLDSNTINVGNTHIINDIIYNMSSHWYKLPKDNISGGITILKADMNNISNNIYVTNKLEKDYTFDLNNYLPILTDNKTLGNNISYSFNNYSETVAYFIKEQPIINNNILTFKTNEFNSDLEQEVAKVDYTVSSQNYNDFTGTLLIKSTNKAKPTVVATPINDLVYGQDLTNLEFNINATYDNNKVEGNITILDSTSQILDSGEHSINLRFIPDDNKTYDVVDLTTNITINKAIANKVNTPVYQRVTTESQMSEVNFIDNGEFYGYDSKSISDYTVDWVDGTATPMYLNTYDYSLNHKNYIFSEAIPLVFDLSGIENGTLPDGTELPSDAIVGDDNSLIIKPGDTINKPNGDVLEFPNGGNVDGNGNIEGDYIITKPDGSIECPNGDIINSNNSEVNFGKDSKDNVIVIIPPNGSVNDIIYPDGGIYYPPTGEVSDENIIIQTPDNSFIASPSTELVIKPQGNLITDNTVTVSDGSEVNLPNGGTINYPPYNDVVVPPGSIIKFPNDSNITLNPDGTLNINGGIVILPDNSIILPDGSKIPSYEDIIIDDNIIEVPKDIIIIKPDGSTIEFPDRGSLTINSNGSIIISGGIDKMPDGSIILPDGGIIPPNKDITISVEDNSIDYIIPNDIIIKHPNEDKDFNYGGTITVNSDNTVTYKPNPNPNVGGGGGSITIKPTKPKNDLDNSAEQNLLPDTDISYIDVNDHWANGAIDYLSKLNIITGYPDNTFKPDNYITRGDTSIVIDKTIEYLDYKISLPDYNKFIDINKSQYFYNPIQKLTSKNILSGYPDNTFKPMNVITREECFVIISKFIDTYNIKLQESKELNIFNDYDEIADWAKPYADNLIKYNIVNGDTNNNINPKVEVTRAEICQMLYNILK